MSDLHKFRNKRGASVAALLEHIPNDGCILVFNAKHRSWRTKCEGILSINKWSKAPVGRDNRTDVCDLYVTWRDE